MQDSRRRIWIDAATQRFGCFAELNAWLGQRCRALWCDIRHPEQRQFSVAEMLEQEQAHLMPMPIAFDGYVESPARVSSTCLVTMSRNRYSVPCEWAGHIVSTRLYPTRVAVVAGDALVASHVRLIGRDQTQYDWQHYIPLIQRKPGALRNGAPFADMPQALRQLQAALLKREGGDRVMARVLAAVLSHGLEAVLVAVEVVLEGGAISEEHIINVLGRLSDPASVQEPLQGLPPDLLLKEPPKADTGRYDALREPVSLGAAEGAVVPGMLIAKNRSDRRLDSDNIGGTASGACHEV